MTCEEFRSRMLECASGYARLGKSARESHEMEAIGWCALSMIDSVFATTERTILIQGVYFSMSAWFIFQAFANRKLAHDCYSQCIKKRQETLDEMWEKLG